MIAYINTFTITGDEQEFRRHMAAHERFLRTQPGFGGFELRRSEVRPEEYTNIVEWETADSHHRLTETREFQTQIANILRTSAVLCSGVSAQLVEDEDPVNDDAVN